MTPTPDYSSPVAINQECPECGDTIPIHWKRCTACWHIALDEEKTRKRVTMRDPKPITCDGCCEQAAEYDPEAVSASQLEGKVIQCEACGDFGRLVLREPDGGDCFAAYLIFRPVTAQEIAANGGASAPQRMIDVSHLPPVYLRFAPDKPQPQMVVNNADWDEVKP